MKQFLVRVSCEWSDWVEAESEEDAYNQIAEDLDMIEHDIYVEECEDE